VTSEYLDRIHDSVFVDHDSYLSTVLEKEAEKTKKRLAALQDVRDQKEKASLKQRCNEQDLELQQLRDKLAQVECENQSLRNDAKKKGKEVELKSKAITDLTIELQRERWRIASLTHQSSSTSMPPADPSLSWGYISPEGQRVFYDIETQKKLDSAVHREGDVTVDVSIGRRKYTINLNIMRQRRRTTGYERDVRYQWSSCVVQLQMTSCRMVWECFVDGAWKLYDRKTQIDLNEAFTKHFLVEATIGDTLHFLDVHGMKQKNSINLEEVDICYRSCGVNSFASTSGAGGSWISWSIPPVLKANSVRVRMIASPGSRVSRETIEFNFAYAQFMRFCGRAIESLEISKVEVYESPIVSAKYVKQAEHFQRARREDEAWVFHGTTHDAIHKIVSEGFRVGGKDVAVKNGKVHGSGVYTSTWTEDPLKYSATSGAVILSQGLLGNHKKGACNHDYNNRKYDSWSPVTNPNWIVFRNSEQLLPKYVIYFCKKKRV